MKQIIQQIKQKKPGLRPLSLFLVLIIALLIWGIGRIGHTGKRLDVGRSAGAQNCWIPPGSGSGGGSCACPSDCGGSDCDCGGGCSSDGCTW